MAKTGRHASSAVGLHDVANRVKHGDYSRRVHGGCRLHMQLKPGPAAASDSHGLAMLAGDVTVTIDGHDRGDIVVVRDCCIWTAVHSVLTNRDVCTYRQQPQAPGNSRLDVDSLATAQSTVAPVSTADMSSSTWSRRHIQNWRGICGESRKHYMYGVLFSKPNLLIAFGAWTSRIEGSRGAIGGKLDS